MGKYNTHTHRTTHRPIKRKQTHSFSEAAHGRITCSLNSSITWHSAAKSSLLIRRHFGSAGPFSRISWGFTRLLRLDEGFADGVSVNALKPCSEGIKMGLDPLLPILRIEDTIALCIIGSDGNTLGGGLTRLGGAEFKGIGDVVLDIVRNSTDVLQFKGLTWVHIVSL